MPTLAEVLKAANVKDEVIAGLPPDVVAAVTGFVSQADTTLQTAAQKETEAREALRLAQLQDKDTKDYVANYGIALTEVGSAKAEAEALRTYLKSLKDQGFDVQIPAATAAVPGSPAMGGNVDVKQLTSQIRGEVGAVFSSYIDANNEHIRLYGYPIPDNSTNIAAQATQARKPVGQFIAEKYNFEGKRKEKADADYQARVDADVKKKVDAERQKDAERLASNPNLRAGEPSRSSVLPIKHDQFQEASGNIPRRERTQRMLQNIHKEVAAIRQTA